VIYGMDIGNNHEALFLDVKNHKDGDGANIRCLFGNYKVVEIQKG
jgi:hypothetical protein